MQTRQKEYWDTDCTLSLADPFERRYFWVLKICYSFVDKSEGPIINGQIILLRQAASQCSRFDQIQPIWAGLAVLASRLFISKGQKVWPFLFSTSLLHMKEDQNVKKSETFSSKDIIIDTTQCVRFAIFLHKIQILSGHEPIHGLSHLKMQ